MYAVVLVSSFALNRRMQTMLWVKSEEYSAEYRDLRLAELARRVRCSTRCMIMVAGAALMIMTVMDAGIIYAL